MKSVDVIYPYYINSTIGPSGTIRRLKANDDYLKSRGYELNFFTYDFYLSKGQMEEVNFSSGLKRRSSIKAFLRKFELTSILFLIRDWIVKKRMVQFYLSLHRRPDVVVFHEADSCYLYMKKSEYASKTVCFFHTDGKRWTMFEKTWPKVKSQLVRKYVSKVLDKVTVQADKLVFIAEIGRNNFLAENNGIAINRTYFFHNGIENIPVQKKQRNGNTYRVCSTGTLCHRKGQYILIEALNRTINKQKIHLSLFGSGLDMDMLKEMTRSYGLEDNVTFHGNVPNTQIHQKLSEEDIFFLMSNNEGLPISIIEAMRAGLPVVSTPIAGIPEQIESGYNGLLINCEINAVVEIFNNIDKYDWEFMGLNSRKRFENEFSFAQMIKSYCDMLDTLNNE